MLLLVSCYDPDTTQCDNNPNPCQNGGKCIEGAWTSYSCDCPDAFCGDNCEVEVIYTLYGNYTGVYICQGETIDKDFIVEEADVCGYPDLLLNRGEFPAKYWKNMGLYIEEPVIWIEPQMADYVPNANGYGRLTKDSLIFWFISTIDTCFYVGSSN